MLDLLITGGHLATASAVYKGDIGIKDGRIAVISSADSKLEALRTIDAAGKIVMPGVIDPHVHYRTPTMWEADTAETTSISGAYGGVTTFFAFIPVGRPGKPLKEQPYRRAVLTAGVQVEEFFRSIIEEAQHESVVDFGIHWLIHPDEALIRQIPIAMKIGITSIKMSLGYPPWRGTLLDDDLVMMVLEQVAGYGGVAMVHCENGRLSGYLENKLMAEGKYTPENYLRARPNLSEAETIYRTICLAAIAGCPLYIVHVTTKEGLENVVKARLEGRNVMVETCYPYLLLTNDDFLKQPELLKASPPLRQADDAKALWRGIQQGFIDTVATDHAPHDRDSEKLATTNFREVPNGLPLIETMLPLLYSEGVVKGKITLTQLVKVLCENSAKIFGLYPKKGVISIGADADLVIIDPTIEWEIREAELHSKAHYTPFEGWRVKGKPVMSFLRGDILLKDGKLHQRPGFGQYIARPASQ